MPITEKVRRSAKTRGPIWAMGWGEGRGGGGLTFNDSLVAIILRLTINSFAGSSSAALWQPDLLMRWCDRGVIRRAAGVWVTVVWGRGQVRVRAHARENKA